MALSVWCQSSSLVLQWRWLIAHKNTAWHHWHYNTHICTVTQVRHGWIPGGVQMQPFESNHSLILVTLSIPVYLYMSFSVYAFLVCVYSYMISNSIPHQSAVLPAYIRSQEWWTWESAWQYVSLWGLCLHSCRDTMLCLDARVHGGAQLHVRIHWRVVFTDVGIGSPH